ncbi:hypothetical protein NP493_195g05018 [Ridgeia piscesae]|uniref:Uncharacterized protein n=1 Tax=Ridgeia piscesae TaxID=27915 RepID=A0AAD9P260_RIDPI|nr:hypothetical protein NP493_195g05018 [Ridgeia piscesae]
MVSKELKSHLNRPPSPQGGHSRSRCPASPGYTPGGATVWSELGPLGQVQTRTQVCQAVHCTRRHTPNPSACHCFLSGCCWPTRTHTSPPMFAQWRSHDQGW